MLEIFSILYLISSLSVRTPYIQPNLLDYEIKLGVEGQDFKYSGLNERENGRYYKGHDFKFQYKDFLYKKINFETASFYKEANNIDKQTIDLGYEAYKGLEMGSGLVYYSWSNSKVSYFIKTAINQFSAEFRINEKDFSKIIEYREIIPLKDNLSLQLIWVYRNELNRDYTQFKIEGRYKL